MKKIFLLLSIFSLIFLTSCEKNLESGEKISKAEKNIFSSKNFLASISGTSTGSTSTGLTSTASTSIDLKATELKLIKAPLKNKWVRDCTEQDFKCVGADDTCKYGSGQNVGGCNFGCGEGNDNVILRKDSDGKEILCNEKSDIGKAAKNNAKNKCLNIYYTGSVANTFCTDTDDGNSCNDGKKKICTCGAGNKWNLSGGKLKISCEKPFCETEGITKVKETEVGGKKAYYLAECRKDAKGDLHFFPQDSDEGKLGFHEIGGKTCSGENIGNSSIFYDKGTSDSKNFVSCHSLISGFSCKKLKSDSATGVWLTSAETNNQKYNNIGCVLGDNYPKLKNFSVCTDSSNSATCIDNSGEALIISGKSLSFYVKSLNNNDELLKNWYYKIKIGGENKGFFKTGLIQSNTNSTSHNLFGKYSLEGGKTYNGEIIPVKGEVTSDGKFVENTGSGINIIFSGS